MHCRTWRAVKEFQTACIFCVQKSAIDVPQGVFVSQTKTREPLISSSENLSYVVFNFVLLAVQQFFMDFMCLSLRSVLWIWSKQMRKYRWGSSCNFKILLCRGYFLLEQLSHYFTRESKLLMSERNCWIFMGSREDERRFKQKKKKVWMGMEKEGNSKIWS